jgi:hypothetical protein
MTRNAENRPWLAGGSQEDSAAGGKSAATVPETSPQSDALFPAEPSVAIARPVPMQTSGRLEFATRCPECRAWHRHIGLGEKDAPCGAHYRLEFASKGAAA